MRKYLNLGCGKRYHTDWVNVDFIVKKPHVIGHDLRLGIPFDDNYFKVVYHSHLLEHFSKNQGFNFMKECYRVLSPGGIIRIAIPDLEKIIGEYIINLSRIRSGDSSAEIDYDWIMLELFDQMVRTKSGGEMMEYIMKDELINYDYIIKRIGEEARLIREIKKPVDSNILIKKLKKTNLITKAKKCLLNYFLHEEFQELRKNQQLLEIAIFRSKGEIHQWMYDEFSISRLLGLIGFVDIKVCNAFDSSIHDWKKFELDVMNNRVLKPDSIFIEARK